MQASRQTHALQNPAWCQKQRQHLTDTDSLPWIRIGIDIDIDIDLSFDG